MTIGSEKIWGTLSMVLILLYVTVGGGYEIYKAIKTKHVGSSLVFSFLSCLIFLGRILYAIASEATRTLWADVYGFFVLLALSILHLIYNRKNKTKTDGNESTLGRN